METIIADGFAVTMVTAMHLHALDSSTAASEDPTGFTRVLMPLAM